MEPVTHRSDIRAGDEVEDWTATTLLNIWSAVGLGRVRLNENTDCGGIFKVFRRCLGLNTASRLLRLLATIFRFAYLFPFAVWLYFTTVVQITCIGFIQYLRRRCCSHQLSRYRPWKCTTISQDVYLMISRVVSATIGEQVILLLAISKPSRALLAACSPDVQNIPLQRV